MVRTQALSFSVKSSFMAIIGIVAVAQNLAIGKDGKLPWHYSADLKFFKNTTKNNAIVMGYNTWASIGKPLPKRLSVVLSRTHEIENQPNVVLVRSREEVLAIAKFLKGEVFIIGGAATYESFEKVIDKWIVTEIPENVIDADAFMPEDFLEGFKLIETENLSDGLIVKSFQRE